MASQDNDSGCGDWDLVIDREMGCTRAEFVGWMPGACGGIAFEVNGNRISIRPGGGEVMITVQEAAPRRLGLLCLPVLSVQMRFRGLSESARADFLKRFDMFTRRGGG